MKLNRLLFAVLFLVLLSAFSSAYLVDSLDVGVIDSGHLFNTYSVDGYFLEVDGEDIEFSFLPVESHHEFVYLNIWVEDSNEDFYVQVWNGSVWVTMPEMIIKGQKALIQNLLSSEYIDVDGVVRLRFLGNGKIFFDKLMLSGSSIVESVMRVEQVDTVGELDKQPPSILVAGTEYQTGDAGKTFLQLSENGIPVDNASCEVNIFYPNGSVWINNQAMLNADEGLQFYNFVAPAIEGVYMVTANCEYYSQDEWFFDLVGDEDFPIRNVITADFVEGSEFVLNNYMDGLYTVADALRSGDYYTSIEYNFTHDQISNITGATLYWMGEGTSDVVLTFYWYNWTSASYQLLPNSLLLSGTVSPQALQPSGISEMVTNDLPSEAINGDGTILIRIDGFDDNQDFTLYNNFLNIRSSQLTGEYPNLLRGGGEIVVDNSENEIISNFESNFNYTNFLINYSRDYLSMQLDDNTTSILEAIAQVSFEANNDTGLILDALNSYFSTLNTSWFGWYDDLLQEHYDTQDLIVNLSIDLNNDYLSLLSQHNLTQGLIDDFRLNVSDEFDITNSLILTEAQALNDSLVSEFNFINNLILSSYTNITGDLSSVTSDIANIDSDLQDHDSDIKDRLDDLESYCDAQFVIVNNKLDLILEKLNIVTSDLNLFAETHDCMEGSVWSIDVTATDNFANYLNFEDINCNITTDIWGTAPLVWDVDSFDYTHECGYGNDTITWVVECDEI